MKCHLPVAQVNGVTIAVLSCQMNSERLGLLLHPAQVQNDQTQGPSRQFYYVSWSFGSMRIGVGHGTLRLACLGDDDDNLRFRGQHVTATWCDIYIAAHPPTTGRRDGAHLLQGFLPDVAPTPFRIPRTLMQMLGVLEFLPSTMTVPGDPASKDSTSLMCENAALIESIRILLGTCTKSVPNDVHPCHWAWAELTHRETWGQLNINYAHDCNTDHIEGWDNNTREFGDAERTIRLMFVPCIHAPQQTLVLGLELVGSVYEEIQQKAKVYLPPHVLPRRRLVDAKPLGETVVLQPPDTSTPVSVASTSTAAAAEIQDAPPGPQVPESQATFQLSDADHVPARTRDTRDFNKHPDPPVARPASNFQDTTVVVPETMNDVVSVIDTLREEIRTLRAHETARELEMQGLKSVLADLKTAHDALDIRLRQSSSSPLTCTAQSPTLDPPPTTPPALTTSVPSPWAPMCARSPSETAPAGRATALPHFTQALIQTTSPEGGIPRGAYRNICGRIVGIVREASSFLCCGRPAPAPATRHTSAQAGFPVL